MRKLTATLCLTLTMFVGSVGTSVGNERPYWLLRELLRVHPDKTQTNNKYIKRARIKILLPGKDQKYFAEGWVNIHLGECQNLMLANGNLTIGLGDSGLGAILPVKNLPIGKTTYEQNTVAPSDLTLNRKTEFSNLLPKPIHWVDIDGDGVDELVYLSACGNRGEIHHFIYEYDDSSSLPQFINPIKVQHLNPAKFPIKKIKTHWSSSSCGSKSKTFESIDGQYILTEVGITDDKTGKCITEIFKRRPNGKFCIIKSYSWKEERKNKGQMVTNPSRQECRFFSTDISLKGKLSDDFQNFLDAYKNGNYLFSLDGFNALARDENAQAQFYLGEMHELGRGVPQNFRIAAEWYKKSASQKHAPAQHNLGLLYMIGEGVTQDSQKAVQLFAQSADQGHNLSMQTLGDMYFLGNGVEKNFEIALKWYKKLNYESNLHLKKRINFIEKELKQ